MRDTTSDLWTTLCPRGRLPESYLSAEDAADPSFWREVRLALRRVAMDAGTETLALQHAYVRRDVDGSR